MHRMKITVEDAAIAIHKYLHDCDSDEVARLYETAFAAVEPGSVFCDGVVISFERNNEPFADLLGNTVAD